MNIKDFVDFIEIPMRERNEEETNKMREGIIATLKSRRLSLSEINYLDRYFFKIYLGLMESEVVFEIFKNLSRQGVWDKTKCKEFYDYLDLYGWYWEAYIVMRLLLLEKVISISKFCEDYDFYIDGTPQFLEEPVWENIDFRKDFDNNFE